MRYANTIFTVILLGLIGGRSWLSYVLSTKQGKNILRSILVLLNLNRAILS